MKTLLTTTALIAFTAGTAAAGCGHMSVADTSVDLDRKTAQERVTDMSTPTSETSDPARTQTAKTPSDASDDESDSEQ